MAKTAVQVSPDKHFVEYDGTSIELPKPVESMTQDDWIALAGQRRSPLRKVSIENQSFLGLHVVLKDKNYIPVWLYAGSRASETPRAFDTMERAKRMGATLVSSQDEIEIPSDTVFSADGHVHRDDVILAKVPIVAYYALQAQNLQKSKAAIEYQAVESRAYEGIDMPHFIQGNREEPLYQASEHTVRYQDRLKF